MGRIKKVATERHTVTLSPAISDFVKQASSVPLHLLPQKLADFPQHWPFPRGDLYHWIPLLDRFDHVLGLFNKEYALTEGPQTQPFQRRLLQKGDAEDGMPYPSTGASLEELQKLGFSEEGDQMLIEAVVHFTRILLEHCGNRSLYASSGHINDLLHTTSLGLLRLCLKLALRLAQRYQVARFKNNNPHAQAVLLANHYAFTMDNLHKLAMPFPKPATAIPSIGLPAMTPSKGKDKATQSQVYNPSDLVVIAKEPQTLAGRGDLSSVTLSYYDQPALTPKPASTMQYSEALPSTPTPVRRTSNLGPSRDRPAAGDRSTSAEDVNTTPVKSKELDSSAASAPKAFQIFAAKIASTPVWALLQEALPSVPTELRYDLLNRIRIAKAFASAESTSQLLLEVRLLAIANLAYAFGETKFQEKLGMADGEEPKRYHLAQQLSDLLQPAASGQQALSLDLETTVLITLEALAKLKHKTVEVSEALAISVNHGILYYELRKVIASLHVEEHADKALELREFEWREATFDVANSVQIHNTQHRSGERMVQAGIIGVLVEILGLRTSRAERFHEKVMQFFASFIHNIASAFQAFANNKGFDLIADLAQHEVDTALNNAKSGNGLPPQFKSKVVDYEIPFFQQSTLRQLFKFTVHMFEHNVGGNDRLLRNLIDTPQMLGALKTVIENAKIFGSNVWGGAVNIMSSFIHNEPTSYSVVGEAGLVKSFLEAVTGEAISNESDTSLPTQADLPNAIEASEGEIMFPSVEGILPVGETMCDIPTAFGAICLNDSHGMQIFQASRALFKYFDIFVSPVHVKALEDESTIATAIGQAFDELSRHHPRLKQQIVFAVISMLKRVVSLCRNMAEFKGDGAKLYKKSDDDKEFMVDGGHAAITGDFTQAHDESREHGTSFTPTQQTAPVTASEVGTMASEHAVSLRYVNACVKFFEGFFHNTGMCALFCEMGGAEDIMDLATLPSNPYDLPAFTAFTKLSSIIRVMCETKAHLVLPSLIRRIQNALLAIKPLVENSRPEGLFASYVDPANHADSPLPAGLDGTTMLKSLSVLHALSDIFGKTLAPPSYTSRHSSQTNQLFTNLNFTDIYIQLVDGLSKLHAACLWESLALQKTVPEALRTKADPRPYMMRRLDTNGYVEIASQSKLTESLINGANADSSKPAGGPLTDEDFCIKNAAALRYVLDQVPKGVESFLHSLGQALVPKRSTESATKQHASLVADHLAKAYLWELDFRKLGEVDEATELKYVAASLQATCRLMLKTSYSMDGFGPKEALTLVLNKFYLNNGFVKLNEYLHKFGQVIANKPTDNEERRTAHDGLHSILDFYGHVVRAKTILDAMQSNVISVRDPKQADYFMPGQFIVEVRDAVLSSASKLWYLEAIETIGESYVKKVIEILRTILKGEGEERSLKRAEHASRRVQISKPKFTLTNTAGIAAVESHVNNNTALAREAVYRCSNVEASAREYASLRHGLYSAPRFPIPEGESANSSGRAPAAPTDAPAAPSDRSVDMTDEDPFAPAPDTEAAPSDDLMSEDDNLGALGDLPADVGDRDLLAMIGSGRLQNLLNFANPGAAGGPSAAPPAHDTRQPFVTVDDLDDKRKALRDALIDRCLEVLSAVPGVTFELADLIQAAVAKSGDSANPRAEIGGTLVLSLMSLQGAEPSEGTGVKISAYAHLVALILQDRDFFDSTLDELKQSFDMLVTWVQLTPDQKTEDAPWMEMILLIIERVLAEDEQPAEIIWDPPPADDPLRMLPELQIPEPTVSTVLRSTLFDALIDVLPKIGKNASLALSVLRVLVTLTRKRDLAKRLSEKHNMNRLYLMIRQLAGSVDEKLHSCFMLILRHMVEDEQIIRQIMQTEIKAALEGHRSSRAMDTTTYTRNLYHLVLRDPVIFVEVSKEMLEIARYDGNPARAQSLALKKPVVPETTDNAQASAEPSAEANVSDGQKPAEAKPPLLDAESPDGVMSFLLRELSNYKDVEDRPPTANKEVQPAIESNSEPKGDVDMADAPATPTPASTAATTPSATPAGPEPSKVDKPVFKPEEHSIYIYRCFILQCLSELLLAYNRTKVEFINFSRKPETQPATPSKPRAGTLNYLLNVLIPVGTLEHKDDIQHRKRVSTSGWATTVLVSLCTKTTERSLKPPRGADPQGEDDPDLTFVRKFVLEHALRTFRDATTSSEPLDQRYSRLLALGELFNRMLNKAERGSGGSAEHTYVMQIGRLMYEKNYIAALTSAIAELDLNFPNVKRAIKYILGPLRLLTDLGVTLSQTADALSSAPGTSTEEDEISSATSVSDVDEDDREQTPDLLRNTTLGMLQSGIGEDQESESDDDDDEDDEDMYDDGYDEEMEYEEEPMPEHGDVVSDEDDEGMGHVEGMPDDVDMDVEIVMDGDEEDEEIDDDEDGDEDDEDEDDEVEFADHMDEITGDDENASMGEGDEEGWEEDDGEAYDGALVHGEANHGGALDHLAMVIGGDERSDDEVNGIHGAHEMGDVEEDYFEEEMPQDDEDGEDEGVDYGEDVVYEPEDEEEDPDDDGLGGWDFEAQPTPAIIRGPPPPHHHQGPPRGFHEMFGMLGGGDTFRAPTFRSHRTASTGRGEHDGTNPLLQREGTVGGGSREHRDAMDTLSRLGRRTLGFPRDNIIQDLVATVGGGGGGAGAFNVTMDMAMRGLPPMFQIQGRPGHALIDLDPARPTRELEGRYGDWSLAHRLNHTRSTGNNDEAHAVEFMMTPTIVRWQEEARMLFGGKHHDKATRIINTLLRLLVPPAMKAKLEHDKAERERKEMEEKAREEEKKKAEAERAEREAKEKQEKEEREAREREETARQEQETRETTQDDGAAMEGVEATPGKASTSGESAPAPPAEQAPVQRVHTTIRGREVDITTLGIDSAFLNEIPEEMREEVIMQALSEQRAQATQAGEQPTEISREFLDALPRHIQTELLRQERDDRRRQERAEAQRRAGAEGGAPPAQPEEMTNADMMAMLDPGLRQTILMDADEATLAALPEELQAEARALFGNQMPRAGGPGIVRREHIARVAPGGGARAEQAEREVDRPRRPVSQMLDKAGVATLLRLMFVSLHYRAKTQLHGILSDVCKNTQNRAEVISILLSILQEGTTDVGAVERSFAQLSVKAKQATGAKTPQPLRRTPTGLAASSTIELSPLNIAQHCIGTLNALSIDNTKVPSFFLTEHETVSNQKAKAAKKGKGRESKAAKYPLNALLALLDRKLITENTGVMETLAGLLSRVTHPLQMLSRRAKENQEEEKSVEAQSNVEEEQQSQSVTSDVPMTETSTASQAAETTDQPTTSEPKPVDNEAAKAEVRKHRELTPPEVPDENIRLVVNILAARECPTKTFSETLDIIKNLSAIPGAKEVFGKELVRQAQELGQTVVVDLEGLAGQINSAPSETDMQGLALANFSSSGSKQRKLLLVLLALDHLFDPKRVPHASISPTPIDPKLKNDVLALLYDSSTFEQLWNNLTSCLAAIRNRGNMVNVATILLPLIEALMVVCRNSTLKEPSSAGTVNSPIDTGVSTPPPDSRMEGLFFKFTEDNRKILNELIRNNPKLMSGNLSILAKNSKVLEFDNKRTYFTRKLKNRGEVRMPHPSLQLSVRRDHVFLDSFKSLYYKSPNEIKYGKLNIRFHGEEGIDAGGVSREWFAAMARQMFNPDYALFNPVASDRTTFHPNPLSEINGEHLLFFNFIGRIIGKALYEGRVLDCHFSRAVYRRILGKAVSLKDMESVDLDYYKSLVWILENDITNVTFETFSIEIDRFGAKETIDLKPHGHEIDVTEENKHEYVQLVVEHRLIKSVEKQLDKFLEGFHEIIPRDLISIFNEQELELLISGLPEIDIEDWKNTTEYHNYQATSPQIQWFWRAVRSFDKEEKAKLLQFVTGTSKVPLNGFKELEGMNGFAKFNIHRDYSSKEKLPSSHTCFNQLDLPEYESYEHLRQQLYTAITAGSEYFGFA